MPDWRQRLTALLEQPAFQHAITALILLNAVCFGLQTSAGVMAVIGPMLTWLDHAILACFVIELALRLVAQGPRFFRDAWNVFDFVVVGIALVPATDSLSALRALRVLRVLRLITTLPRLRAVVAGLLHAVPGLSSIAGLLCLLLYVSAVVATNLYAETSPELFGTLGASALTLFQIMTLEGWADIMREVMRTHPYAPLFFVPFVIGTTFTVLNLFIAVIVESMQASRERVADTAVSETGALKAEIVRLAATVEALRADLNGAAAQGSVPP